MVYQWNPFKIHYYIKFQEIERKYQVVYIVCIYPISYDVHNGKHKFLFWNEFLFNGMHMNVG